MEIDFLQKLLVNVLTALYQPFWFAVIMAVFLMQIYLTLRQSSLKEMLANWYNSFRKEKEFRYLFFFFFYLVMILFRTLLNREMWRNPLEDVIGTWWIYGEDGKLITECIENFILLLPFAMLMWLNFRNKLCKKKFGFCICIWQSLKVTFLFSLVIEFLQLFLRLGTFQLSDLFYNTLGGLTGGLIYWGGYKIAHRKRNE